MSCNIEKEQLRAYALNLCNSKDTEDVVLHVQSCAVCRKTLGDLERTEAVLAGAFEENPPDWLVQKTIARVRERRERAFSWRGWGIPIVSGVVVTLLIVLLTGIKLDNRRYTTALQTRSADSRNDHPVLNNTSIQRSSLFDAMADDMELDLNDPVSDRSIYESLDIAPEVASLLL